MYVIGDKAEVFEGVAKSPFLAEAVEKLRAEAGFNVRFY